MKQAGKFYGIGVGPGDPELMTLKAVRLIKENDIIAVPGAEVRETVAYKIAVQAVPELAEKELLPIYMPMTHDKAELELNHEKGAKALEAALDTGKNVVFLTLGDPTIYSTFSYVQKRVEADGYETRLVSGITSFCATAARLNIPLTEWNQPLHVQPAVHRLDSELDQPGTYVLMKSGRKMNQVKEILARSGREVRMVENCGMPDEHIYNSVEEIPDAGKTTTISLLSTLLLPTKGEILIDGQQLTRQRPDLKRKISVITQEYSMRQDMNMDEIMEYQGRLYFMPRKQIKERTEELLEFCDLLKFRKRTVRKLSGGMKRKLMVCRALLTDPEILLLDEPTAGMDALSRRQMWNLLRKLNEKNLTILLTTHYMEEAQSLCNRVALMDHGKLEEVSTPSALIESLGAYAVDEMTADGTQNHYFHTRQEAIRYLEELTGQASLRETTLEDVFVERAGKHLISK